MVKKDEILSKKKKAELNQQPHFVSQLNTFFYG